MKNLTGVAAVLGLLLTSPASTVGEAGEGGLDHFDPVLAEELGADERGMRQYVMVILQRGPKTIGDDARRAELQAGHMANIRHMAEQGELVLAGPFLDGGDYRGIFVLAVDEVDDAQELVSADPAVQAGLLTADFRPWYGSAALMKVNEIHRRITPESR